MCQPEIVKGSVRAMEESDLALVREWRNHRDIKRYMYTQHEIGVDEHRKWFAEAIADAGRHLLIFEYETEPRGFVHFQKINDGSVANWGFYVAPNSPRGTGMCLGMSALAFAFDRKMHKICGQVLDYNERSMRLHHRLGFKQEGVLRDQHFDGTTYHSVVCFGLLKNEWHNR